MYRIPHELSHPHRRPYFGILCGHARGWGVSFESSPDGAQRHVRPSIISFFGVGFEACCACVEDFETTSCIVSALGARCSPFVVPEKVPKLSLGGCYWEASGRSPGRARWACKACSGVPHMQMLRHGHVRHVSASASARVCSSPRSHRSRSPSGFGVRVRASSQLHVRAVCGV